MTGSAAAMGLGFTPISPLCAAAPGYLGSFLVLFGTARRRLRMRSRASVERNICVADCAAFYSPDDGEEALCRQPDFILWPPPKLQHQGNKPFSSNPQTVQQSMGNYVCNRWPGLSISPSQCLSRCPLCILSPSRPPPRPPRPLSSSHSSSSFLLHSPLLPPSPSALHLKCDSSAAPSP